MSSEQDALAERLRTCREYAGFSQQQVADYLGVHRPTVSEIEAGRRKVDALELASLCRLYQKPMAYFLGQSIPPLDEATTALLAGLDGVDRAEVIQFAEFLAWRKRAIARP